MENKIISMYAKGMSTFDIEDHIRDIYGLEISDITVSRITNINTWNIKDLVALPTKSATKIPTKMKNAQEYSWAFAL